MEPEARGRIGPLYQGLGFGGLGFRGLGFRGLGYGLLFRVHSPPFGIMEKKMETTI